jgi:Glycosyltransferase family 87
MALLIGVTVYGLVHEKLLTQPLWTPVGWRRWLGYSLAYWTIAWLLLRFAPRRFEPSRIAPRTLASAAAIFVAIYTVWWAGVAAPVAVLYFLGSCFFTGRILSRRADPATATLLGLTLWMFAIWAALHFPVNTRITYAIALAIPYAWGIRHGAGFRPANFGMEQKPLALALLLFVLLAHWLVALKPEISADGLSMHLALPMAVENSGSWGFDFQRQTWALMPAGGDCLFTAAYLLGGAQGGEGAHGGEAAARLLNFALLVLTTWLVARASRSYLMAALFASTPLAHMVSGSLFVENVWAALILGGALGLVRYADTNEPFELRTAGALLGAALAVKLTAVVFVAPAALVGIWLAARRSQFRVLTQAAAVLAVLAAPPYVYSLVKTGNPVFPFGNTIFHSPYYDTAEPFSDLRYVAPLSFKTPYDVTFRSGSYSEGHGGATGFQYFLLLIPAALLLRRRDQWMLFGIAAAGTVVLFAVLPYLRYWYPALPLFSIALAGLLQQWPRASAAMTALIVLNLLFWPVAGLYHRDFAVFTRQQAAAYLQAGAPQRALVGDLNRRAPGEPVAFLATDAVAGLQAQAYTDSWHSDKFWGRLKKARTPSEVAEVLRDFGIKHIIAPEAGIPGIGPTQTFLRRWIEPEVTGIGGFGVYRPRNTGLETPSAGPFPPGVWDDGDARIAYAGPWIRGTFEGALTDSVTYSDEAGDSFKLAFRGSAITYIFAKAPNRGVALVTIDGQERARIDMYSPAIEWQSKQTFETNRGVGGDQIHMFEVRVLGEKNPLSSGTYVDLDGIVAQ